jgi:hypothetical protein
MLDKFKKNKGTSKGLPGVNTTFMQRLKANRLLTVLLALFLLLCITGAALVAVFCAGYNSIKFKALSAMVTYRETAVLIDDEEKPQEDDPLQMLMDQYDRSPIISRSGNRVSIDSNGIEDVHMLHTYTGGKKYVYTDNNQWVDFIKVGGEYPGINTTKGYHTTRLNTFTMQEVGWYTVFAIWYINDEKCFITQNYLLGDGSVSTDVVDEDAIEEPPATPEVFEESKKIWSENKDKIKKTAGIKNILIMGMAQEQDSEDEIVEQLTVVSINSNEKNVNINTLNENTYVYISRIGAKRLARAYYYGGTELMVQTVEENCGINIDRYIKTKTEDVAQAIALVKGVYAIKSTYAPWTSEPTDPTAVSESQLSAASFLKALPKLTSDITFSDYSDLFFNTFEDVHGYNPLKIAAAAYLLLVLLVAAVILYLAFLRKRGIVYVNLQTGECCEKTQKFRFNEKIRPYRQTCVPGQVAEMFMDKKKLFKVPHSIKMPMHKLKLYVVTTQEPAVEPTADDKN